MTYQPTVLYHHREASLETEGLDIEAIFAEAAEVSIKMRAAFDALQAGASRKEELRRTLLSAPSNVAGKTLAEVGDQASLWDMVRDDESWEAYNERMAFPPPGTVADFDKYQQLVARFNEACGSGPPEDADGNVTLSRWAPLTAQLNEALNEGIERIRHVPLNPTLTATFAAACDEALHDDDADVPF